MKGHIINKIFLCVYALAAFAANATASDALTVVLKNGSELTGFISRQRPGEKFTFSSSKSIMALPGKDIFSIRYVEHPEDSLPADWKKWADENDAYVTDGGRRTLVLSEIITKSGTVKQVRILEKGVRVRYLSFSPQVFSLGWDSIESVKADKRPKLLISGVNRRYILASGEEYEGQYLGEIPGKTLSILLDNGIIEVLDSEEVVTDRCIKLNPLQSLYEQSMLVDIIITKDSTCHTGIVYERNYPAGNSSDKDHLLLQLGDGSTERINLDEIDEYLKEKNPGYREMTGE